MNDQPEQPLPPPAPEQPEHEPGMTSRRHDMATAVGCFVVFGVASLSVIVLLYFLINMAFAFVYMSHGNEGEAPLMEQGISGNQLESPSPTEEHAAP